jgi:hypothetical protein
MVSDGWRNNLQSAVYARADIARRLDSPFSDKSAETLIQLGNYIGTLGLENGLLGALSLISSSLGTNSDTWLPGEHQLTILTSAGYGTEGIAPELLLGDLIDRGVQDLVQRYSTERRSIPGEIAKARAEAFESVRRETLELAEARDQALGDLDQLRAEKQQVEKEREHALGLLRAIKPTKVRRKATNGKAKKPPASKAEKASVK